MSVSVLKPGLLTTVQDAGRLGYRQYGIVEGGAMDPFAYRAANILVGNAANAAALEMTLLGPALLFEREALIAIAGADLSPTIDGEAAPLWEPLFVAAGAVLRFGAARSGCRAYLAIGGGFDVPVVMGSRSTMLSAGIGGFSGRALQEGDVLERLTPSGCAAALTLLARERLKRPNGKRTFAGAGWQASASMLPAYGAEPVVRVLPGGQYERFSPSYVERFFAEAFVVDPESNRMGYRLTGGAGTNPIPPPGSAEDEMLSEPVAFGTIQVPSGGKPIVLMADRQTTGGYPRIAEAIAADLPLLAQLRPGDRVRFRLTELWEAQRLNLWTEAALAALRAGVRAKATRGGGFD
ncbi:MULTISPECIES: biotin-dependent carboxyltransferase family protein [Cohnella]|uniref:5-oxoprolinase subunit C family protein n=1 Tax=Cohnella TaxID=329857 RepID=UPI0009BB0306|nr:MULTISPECIES: biotin-dependent carboxyltransferase family protein [Cohnella]MBN2980346.1 biotin-dependent carboxyltransferase family protein [Cohnella algarum]